MYNGIGLETARGSGTNGYVQRNLSQVRHHKDNRDYKSEEEIKKLDNMLNKKPNVEILEHERKRKVELKCVEMEELMEEQGYNEDEIEEKVALFRKMLVEKEGTANSSVDKDEFGRPLAKATHQLAEANEEKNLLLRKAFGLSEFYVDGSAFDPNRKAKEAEAAAKVASEKQYSIIRESNSRSKSPSPKRHKGKEKKKKKQSARSPSPHRNSKKQSRSRSRSPHKKRSEKRSKSKSPKRHHSKRSRSRSPGKKPTSNRSRSRSRSQHRRPNRRSRSASRDRHRHSRSQSASHSRRNSDRRSKSQSASPPRHKKKDKKKHRHRKDSDDFPLD